MTKVQRFQLFSLHQQAAEHFKQNCQHLAQVQLFITWVLMLTHKKGTSLLQYLKAAQR